MNQKIRQGRRNLLEFSPNDDKTVRKIAVVSELVRPNRLMVEAWALSHAKERGIHVPAVVEYYRDSENHEVMTLERIVGRVLSREKTPENIDCMYSVGEQMSNLEGVSSGFGWIDPISGMGTSESWEAFLHGHLSGSESRLLECGDLPEEISRAVHGMIDRFDLSLPQPYLVHRDIKPSNIMRDEEGNAWILDWENTMLGDPIYDISMFGMKYGHGAQWEALRAGYGLVLPEERYGLYEIIGLIGMIDFYKKHGISYGGRMKQLIRMIRAN